MKRSVTKHLIWKDWQLNKGTIILCTLGGGIALTVICMGGQTPFLLGAVGFFIALIMLASILPALVIVNERKKQNLAFVMSLPVTSGQYGVAKLASTVGIFLVPWLTLIAAGMWIIKIRHVLPEGVIPMGLILTALPLIGFCLIAGAALIGETEGWYTLAVAVVNSSYWFVWYTLMMRFPELPRNWLNAKAVWSPAVPMILGGELAVTALVLGGTLFIQSRKRDFI